MYLRIIRAYITSDRFRFLYSWLVYCDVIKLIVLRTAKGRTSYGRIQSATQKLNVLYGSGKGQCDTPTGVQPVCVYSLGAWTGAGRRRVCHPTMECCTSKTPSWGKETSDVQVYAVNALYTWPLSKVLPQFPSQQSFVLNTPSTILGILAQWVIE